MLAASVARRVATGRVFVDLADVVVHAVTSTREAILVSTLAIAVVWLRVLGEGGAGPFGARNVAGFADSAAGIVAATTVSAIQVRAAFRRHLALFAAAFLANPSDTSGAPAFLVIDAGATTELVNLANAFGSVGKV